MHAYHHQHVHAGATQGNEYLYMIVTKAHEDLSNE